MSVTSFFRDHELPPLFAAVAIESFGIPVPRRGSPPEAASEAGRACGALLLRKYRHLFPHEQAAAAATLDAFVRGGVAQGLQSAGTTDS